MGWLSLAVSAPAKLANCDGDCGSPTWAHIAQTRVTFTVPLDAPLDAPLGR